jgi:hypothetical protein
VSGYTAPGRSRHFGSGHDCGYGGQVHVRGPGAPGDGKSFGKNPLAKILWLPRPKRRYRSAMDVFRLFALTTTTPPLVGRPLVMRGR